MTLLKLGLWDGWLQKEAVEENRLMTNKRISIGETGGPASPQIPVPENADLLACKLIEVERASLLLRSSEQQIRISCDWRLWSEVSELF